MKIKCKKTKRFLCEVNIEDYLMLLESMGITHLLPLEVIVPCRACHKVEIYKVYKDHYEFDRNKT